MSNDLKTTAKYIAITVRNAMEDFHAENLSDKQMRELNPIIRNAIYTALHAQAHAGDNEGCRVYIQFQEHLIPEYWEEPELLDEYKGLMEAVERRKEQVKQGG